MARQEEIDERLAEKLEILHCLEKAICKKIEQTSRELSENRVVVAWDILTQMLKENQAFREMGIDPTMARGLMAEIMFKYIVEVWAKDRNIPYIYYNNLLIPRADSGTTQLDGVFITPSFAIVVECKSYRGKLLVKDGKISTRTHHAYPWKQNYGHIMSLKDVLGDLAKVYFHNVVYIFSEGVITEYDPSPEEYLIVNKVALSSLDHLNSNQNFSNSLSQSDMSAIAGILDKYIPSVEEEEEHIMFVNSLVRDR